MKTTHKSESMRGTGIAISPDCPAIYDPNSETPKNHIDMGSYGGWVGVDGDGLHYSFTDQSGSIQTGDLAIEGDIADAIESAVGTCEKCAGNPDAACGMMSHTAIGGIKGIVEKRAVEQTLASIREAGPSTN